MQLCRLGIDVDVFCWTRRLNSGVMETVQGPAVDLPANLSLHRFGLYGNWDLSQQHTLNVLEWLGECRRPDAVWGHYLYPAGFIAVLFAHASGLACTVSARGNDVDRLMFPPGDFARLLWTLQRADQITAVSHDLARKIRLLLGDDTPTPVIHNSVDIDLFHPAPASSALRQRLGIAPDEAVIAFCGELRHKKGSGFLLQALVDVRRVRPACLLIVGERRNDETAGLSDFLADHPADAARVLCTGHLEDPRDVAAHLQLADVVTLPSLWDGLPNALLEAMSCAKIVVASNAGGIPEALDHEQNGFILPKSHLHRLGEAIVDVLSLSSERRHQVGQAAREKMLTHFTASRERTDLQNAMANLQVGARARR